MAATIKIGSVIIWEGLGEDLYVYKENYTMS